MTEPQARHREAVPPTQEEWQAEFRRWWDSIGAHLANHSKTRAESMEQAHFGAFFDAWHRGAHAAQIVADSEGAELESLREALRKYGNHEVVDGVRYCAYYDNKPCNCGFEAALSSVPAPTNSIPTAMPSCSACGAVMVPIVIPSKGLVGYECPGCGVKTSCS